MRRLIVNFVRLTAVAAILWPVGLFAQTSDKRSATPPNVAAQPSPFRVLASAPFPEIPDTIADLVVVQDRAAIRLRNGRVERFVTIDAVEQLLALLADRRMTPLWPALIDWAGTGAERLRDAHIEAARRAFADARPIDPLSTAESAVRPKTRALLRLATQLDSAGRRDEAIALLKTNRPAAPGRNDRDRFAWVALATRLSGIYREADDVDHALAALDEAAALMGNEQYFSVNLKVNRAALLAESGRYAEALKTIDAALAAFGQSEDHRGAGDHVPGSGREFSWIRACALRGLGRIAEADAEAAQMLADANPTDYQFVVKSTAAIAVRYALCVDDRRLAARVLASDIARRPVGAPAFEMLQPARVRRTREAAFFAAVRDEPVLIEALRDWFRVLPDAFAPALNRWYPAPAPVTPPAR